MMNHSCKRYFSLIEFLITLAVISMLVGGVSYYQLTSSSMRKNKAKFDHITSEITLLEMLGFTNGDSVELCYKLNDNKLSLQVKYNEDKYISFDKLHGARDFIVDQSSSHEGTLILPTTSLCSVVWDDFSISNIVPKVRHAKD